SIRSRTPALKQLLHREVPGRAMSGMGQTETKSRASKWGPLASAVRSKAAVNGPWLRSASLPLDDLHHGVLGEAKVAGNRTPREAGVVPSTSALNGRWRLISAMYARTREGPYKIPCAIDTRKARESGVFDVSFRVVQKQLILHTKMFARH